MKSIPFPKASSLSCIAAIALFYQCSAQSGSLDLTFDMDGKVTTAVGSEMDFGSSVSIQEDGKIVVAGYSEVNGNTDFAVVRYNSDGSLDLSFGSGGKVTTDLGGNDDVAGSVAIQNDGKIVVAGYGRPVSNNDIAIVRYNSDGSLDTSFDEDGIVTTPIGNASDYGFAVVIQDDGKIVVAGSSSDMVVVRYNEDGSLDDAFGGDGIVVVDLVGASEALSIALQPNGKIVIAGYLNDIYTDIVVVRINEDGSLDSEFDSDGIVRLDIGGLNDKAFGVAIQSDAKIVITAATYEGLDLNYALVRFNPDGSLDTSLDGDGIVTTDVASINESPRAVVIQNAGKILVTGLGIIGSNYFIVVVKYNSDGSLDTTFDEDGIVTTNIGSTSEGQSIALQTDGKIVVAGYAMINGNPNFAVVRYNNGGTSSIQKADGVGNEINAFPNPCVSHTTLQLANYLDHATIDVCDIFGQTIKRIENFSGANFTLQVDDMAVGLYHIVISQNGMADKLCLVQVMH